MNCGINKHYRQGLDLINSIYDALSLVRCKREYFFMGQEEPTNAEAIYQKGIEFLKRKILIRPFCI